jgi:hypothetical protein
MSNANRGVADGTELVRKHATKTHKTFGWLKLVVMYILLWVFGYTSEKVRLSLVLKGYSRGTQIDTMGT